MKKVFATSLALATLIASATAAVSAPRRNVVQPSQQTVHRPSASTEVHLGNQVVGQDPDPDIRAGLLHDPNPNAY